MKARILENGKCILLDQEFLDFKGAEIDNWNLTEVLPSSNLLIPIWNGSEWIESITPEDIASRKIERNLELNKLQYAELKVTDWAFIRKSDTGDEIPIEIVNERNEIRLKYNKLRL